jgi:hypothetical protein
MYTLEKEGAQKHVRPKGQICVISNGASNKDAYRKYVPVFLSLMT